MKKWLVILSLVLAVAGCSSTPDKIVSYLLPTGNNVTEPHNSSHKLLVVPPVDVSSYLAGAGLVYQTSPTEIVEAQQNLWAESLSKQLTRRIIYDLRQKQAMFWPTQLTPTLSTAGLPRLQVRIDKFNAVYTGVVDVEGEWMLISANGKLETVHPFSYSVPLVTSGYAAQVEALSKGVNDLTTQIANELK